MLTRLLQNEGANNVIQICQVALGLLTEDNDISEYVELYTANECVRITKSAEQKPNEDEFRRRVDFCRRIGQREVLRCLIEFAP